MSLSNEEVEVVKVVRGAPAPPLAAARKRAPNDSSVTSPNSEAPPPKKASRKSKKAEEKRLKRFRSKCPAAIQQRIDRAVTQRMYLVERGDVENHKCKFVVLGSTGNVYNVSISHVASCSCPDHLKGNLCKHILFVLLKVMGLPRDSNLIYQAAWLTSELDDMFAQSEARRGGGKPSLRTKGLSMYAKVKSGEDLVDHKTMLLTARQVVEQDSNCPICFESLVQCKERLTYCRAQCGANFHAKCIEHWIASQSSRSASTTCPNCRQPWENNAQQSIDHREGYSNLGKAQGQSPQRDTSTYYSPDRYYKRRYW